MKADAATRMVRTDAANTGFQSLVIALDNDLEKRYASYRERFTPENNLDQETKVVLAVVNNQIAGCGALRIMQEPQTAELKRMFVQPGFRGKGISKQILSELEQWAKQSGMKYIKPETGKNQPEAIKLYRNAGYTITAPYGAYTNIPEAICMIKEIESAT